MNEQRHFYKQRFGTEQPSNQTKETKEQLLAAVLSFIDKNRSITATDWMALDGIIKQLLPNCINIFQQMYSLATSKVIVIDTYCITTCILPHKKDTKINK